MDSEISPKLYFKSFVLTFATQSVELLSLNLPLRSLGKNVFGGRGGSSFTADGLGSENLAYNILSHPINRVIPLHVHVRTPHSCNHNHVPPISQVMYNVHVCLETLNEIMGATESVSGRPS